MQINLENRAPVQVGLSCKTICILGTFGASGAGVAGRHVPSACRWALPQHPSNPGSPKLPTSSALQRSQRPSHLRVPWLDALRGSVSIRFNVSIQAYALGERFNDPWPSLAMLASYPSDLLHFDVEVRRMNRPPLFFLDRPSFSVTQLQGEVILDGMSVADPDAREEDLFELLLEVEGPGGVAFNGEQGRRIRQQLTLRQMNQLLQRLTFAARQESGLVSFKT